MAAITRSETEVIAFHNVFFCHGVGYNLPQHANDTPGLQRKSIGLVYTFCQRTWLGEIKVFRNTNWPLSCRSQNSGIFAESRN
jgi:hypothetical protein